MVERLLEEDLNIIDVTTFALEIGEKKGKMEFFAREEMVICGLKYVAQIFEERGIEVSFFAKDSQKVQEGQRLFSAFSTAKELHEVWKVSLNILEQLSGVATKTNKMLNIAKEGNKNIVLATTRKHFPLTKDMMIHAVLSGGGIFHRLGLYDSILIFTQHRNFFDTKVEFEEAFKRAKDKFLEKKIVVEVDSFDEACYFASLGADVLQCEKMGYEELKECVGLKKEYSHIKVLATGGINLTNAKEYASCGVDALVTSSVYSANPCDIKAVITKVSDE